MFQDVNLATGRLVFSWDMLAHVDPADSEQPASSASSSDGVWDAFHMNAAELGPHGQLLVSARNMWSIYDISTRTGKIRWQLGGKKSDFRFGPGASFFWQHDARFRPGHAISMFDDGCCELPDGTPEQQSHGLILHLSFRRRLATVVRTYYHHPGLPSPTQGNLQALRNGNEFIGWGLVVKDARTGFQTAIRVPSRWRYFRVRALGAHGNVLGTSRIVKLAR